MSVGYLQNSKHVLSGSLRAWCCSKHMTYVSPPILRPTWEGDLAVSRRPGVPANTSRLKSMSLESRALGFEGRIRACHMTSRGEAFGTVRTAHAVAQKLGLVLLEQLWVLEWG